jgi:hypothetical protein
VKPLRIPARDRQECDRIGLAICSTLALLSDVITGDVNWGIARDAAGDWSVEVTRYSRIDEPGEWPDDIQDKST